MGIGCNWARLLLPTATSSGRISAYAGMLIIAAAAPPPCAGLGCTTHPPIHPPTHPPGVQCSHQTVTY
jgi:hypothetical protein